MLDDYDPCEQLPALLRGPRECLSDYILDNHIQTIELRSILGLNQADAFSLIYLHLACRFSPQMLGAYIDTLRSSIY